MSAALGTPRRAARPLLDPRLGADPPSVRILKRAILAFLAVHVTLASVSGYRAIVQVYRVEIRAPTALRPGGAVGASITTSGRTRASLELELVQGPVVRSLGVRTLPGNWDGVYDPFPRHDSLAATLGPATLTGFHAGPAVLRATGRGSSQWLRTPPPVVREMKVEIAPR